MDELVEFISSPEISNLALTLIHFIWQGALIASCLWVTLLCTPKNKFKLRYRSAVFALMLCIASPIATFSFLTYNPAIGQADLAQINQIKNKLTNSISDTGYEMGALTADNASNIDTVSYTKNTNYLGYVLLVWLIGCVTMTLKFVLDLNRTFRLTREGVAKVSYRVENIVNTLSAKYELKRRITILKSRKVNVPVVIGWLRPVILLPIAISIGLETKHLELIIAHELAHIKRMDFAVNLVQSFVQICLFYHPVIYWINKVIRDEREYICDQLAVEVLGNDESAKINLAKALLGTEELREGNLSLVAVAASGGMLKHRISHILDSQYKPATSIKSLFIGIMVFLFSFAALSTTFEFSDNNVVIAAKLKLTENSPIQNSNKRQIKGELTENLSQSPQLRFVKPDIDRRVSNGESKVGNKELRDDFSSKSVELAEKRAERKTSNKSNKSNTAELILSSPASHSRKPVPTLADKRAEHVLDSETARAPRVLKKPENKTSGLLTTTEQTANKVLLNQTSASKVNDELFRELSSKALTDQYFLPAAAVSEKSRLLKTAALDLQSIASFKEPKAIFTPYPKYPRRAWDKMINQTVRVNFNITKAGVVGDISIMQEADRDFSREIKRKLRSWKYQPAVKDGRNVAYATSLEFVFKAPQEDPIIPITTGSRIRRQ